MGEVNNYYIAYISRGCMYYVTVETTSDISTMEGFENITNYLKKQTSSDSLIIVNYSKIN